MGNITKGGFRRYLKMGLVSALSSGLVTSAAFVVEGSYWAIARPAAVPIAVLYSAGHAIGLVTTAHSAPVGVIVILLGGIFGTWFVIVFLAYLAIAKCAKTLRGS
jgi:hypothetical protein